MREFGLKAKKNSLELGYLNMVVQLNILQVCYHKLIIMDKLMLELILNLKSIIVLHTELLARTNLIIVIFNVPYISTIFQTH